MCTPSSWWSTRFLVLQIRSVIYGYTNVYVIIMVVNTLLDVADTLGDLRLHECIRHLIIMVVNTLIYVVDTLGDLRLQECIRHHHGDQHAS